MKKLIGPLVLLLIASGLVGCSGGVRVPGSEDIPEMGSLVFRLRSAEVATMDAAVLPDPTLIRVIVRHSNGFELIHLVDLPADEEVVELRVPVAEGYRVDAISQHNNDLLKHDSAFDVNVQANTVTEVSLVLEPFALALEFPDEVTMGESFTVEISGWSDLLSISGRLKLDTDPWETNTSDGPLSLPSISSYSPSRNAPQSDQEGLMYAQVFIFIHHSLVKANENYTQIRLWYPNLSHGADLIAVPLLEPDGGIIVDVTY